MWKGRSFRAPFFKSWGYALVFTLKVAVAVALWELHIQFFGDAYQYLFDAQQLNAIFTHSPSDYFKLLTGWDENLPLIKHYFPNSAYWTNSGIYNDAKNTIRFNAILQLLSFGQIYIHLCWISFLTLLGMKAIYDTLVQHISKTNVWVFLSVLLFPSLTFWGASFLKETFLIFGFGLFFRACFGELTWMKRLSLVVIGGFVLVCIKPYVLVCLLLGVVVFYTLQVAKHYRLLIAPFVLIVCIVVGWFAVESLYENPLEIMSKRQQDFMNVGKGGLHITRDTCFFYFTPNQVSEFEFQGDSAYLQSTLKGEIIHFGTHHHSSYVFHPNKEPWDICYLAAPSGSYIPVTPIDGSFKQLVLNIPEALCNVLLRPFPNDPPQIKAKWLALAETFFLFSFLLIGIVRRPKLTSTQKNTLLSLAVFIVTLSLIIGWVVPVIGAIIRYRIPVTIALIWITLVLWQRKKEEIKTT